MFIFLVYAATMTGVAAQQSVLVTRPAKTLDLYTIFVSSLIFRKEQPHRIRDTENMTGAPISDPLQMRDMRTPIPTAPSENSLPWLLRRTCYQGSLVSVA